MNEYKRILVVSRMIQSSRKAIHYGVSLAHKYKAQLYVIHSIYNPFSLRGWSVGTLALGKEYQRILADTKKQLSELVELEKKKGMSIKELVREGEPTAEILKTIEEEQIDLLVMLAHEEGRLEDLFFNKSNDELVRKMPCSIMLVKKEAEPLAEEDEDDIEDEDDVEEKEFKQEISRNQFAAFLHEYAFSVNKNFKIN